VSARNVNVNTWQTNKVKINMTAKGGSWYSEGARGTVALCLWTYGDPRGVGISYERGSPVISLFPCRFHRFIDQDQQVIQRWTGYDPHTNKLLKGFSCRLCMYAKSKKKSNKVKINMTAKGGSWYGSPTRGVSYGRGTPRS
jgi:hypothetical protein